MTKSDLIAQIAKGNDNLTQKDAEIIVDLIFDSMIDTLVQGEKIEIRGFGSFKVKQRDARTGRNPQTGESIDIPAKKVPSFKTGKQLQEMMNKDQT